MKSRNGWNALNWLSIAAPIAILWSLQLVIGDLFGISSVQGLNRLSHRLQIVIPSNVIYLLLFDQSDDVVGNAMGYLVFRLSPNFDFLSHANLLVAFEAASYL